MGQSPGCWCLVLAYTQHQNTRGPSLTLRLSIRKPEAHTEASNLRPEPLAGSADSGSGGEYPSISGVSRPLTSLLDVPVIT